jgi:RNA polymerase sigma-70 factor (ECF subfamily)
MAQVYSLRGQDEPFAKIEAVAPPITDEALVAAAKSGNHSAFVELWARHSNLAFRTACRIIRNHDDAEDLIQDVWIKVYVHLETFDGRAKFSTWLTRITINSALMTLRQRRTHPEISMEAAVGETKQCYEIADRGKNIEEFFVRHEIAEHLRLAIGHLRPALRNAVKIHQSHHCSIKQVAELAGISVAATKSRLLRARCRPIAKRWDLPKTGSKAELHLNRM